MTEPKLSGYRYGSVHLKLRSPRNSLICCDVKNLYGVVGGSWLAQLVEHETLDLTVMSSSLSLDVEPT